MLIKRPPTIKPSAITPRRAWLARRRFVQGVISAAALGAMPGTGRAAASGLAAVKNTIYSSDEELTPWDAVTSYNNFYEFGTDKTDPKKYSGKFRPRPWSVSIGGECERPGTYNLEDIIRPHRLEERIYRLRCVEAWSMVIPWVGIPLAAVLRQFKPLSSASYVQFVTIMRPKEMPGLGRRVLNWPYREGLRIDEAMHPLTLLTIGLYGEQLPNQNGAPLRLVVPWKYGFKSIKSIIKINFTRRQPLTSWHESAPHEYGFYANVNPAVDHPRWSQAKERRIGELFKRKTLPFNGYAAEVASLYSGMDLQKYF